MNNMLSTEELTRIEEGMTVIDVNGDKVGTVEFVRFGDEDYTQPGPETSEVYYATEREDTFIDIVAQVFDPHEIDAMPKELQERMYRHGFLKVDPGLFHRDRYVLLDNVNSVMDSEVHLSITKDELFNVS